jgi:Tol biopolymer transport system component
VYRQLTFQRGWIGHGKFSPDGESVTYSANWNGLGRRLYSGRARALNWQAHSSEPIEIASISKDGDILVLRNIQPVLGFATQATLATIPATGGTPKDLMDGVQDADYSPDGQTIALSRLVNGQFQIESPPGKVLYKAPQGYLSDVRFARDGKSIAFFEHPTLGDARGLVAMVDLNGQKRDLTRIYSNIDGSAWHPSGELWFTASETGLHQALFALNRQGTVRVVERVPGNLRLLDISSASRVLLSHETLRRGLMAYSKEQKREVDLAWFDWSNLRAISDDGKFVLIEEEGEGGGPEYTIFLRNVNGDPPTRVGSGLAAALSPDLKWVWSSPIDDTKTAVLLPTGVGEPKKMPGDIEHIRARFLSDSKRVIFTGRREGKLRSYVQNIEGGEPTPVTPEGLFGLLLTPDEKKLLVVDSSGKPYLFDLASGEKEPVTPTPNDLPLRFASTDSLFVVHFKPDRNDEVDIQKLELRTGKRTTIHTLRTDATGLITMGPIAITPDGTSYAFSVMRAYSDLYIVDGLK